MYKITMIRDIIVNDYIYVEKLPTYNNYIPQDDYYDFQGNSVYDFTR